MQVEEVSYTPGTSNDSTSISESTNDSETDEDINNSDFDVGL